MWSGVEEHKGGEHRVITKGNKEFVYTKEDIKRIQNTDTPSTKKFKKAYRIFLNNERIISALQEFFQNPNDSQKIKTLEQYVPLFNLKFKIKQKNNQLVENFHIKAVYSLERYSRYLHGIAFSEDFQDSMERKLLSADYFFEISYKKRYLLFFDKSIKTEIKISLTQDLNKIVLLKD